MSSINIDDDQIWVPSHVQVTVLRGRGLRSKGKHGTSDVYTIIQVGKEKYSTCVVEKTTSPEWKEECCFELLPGVLEDGERSAYPPGSSDLILTVMHRALIGMDVFLGQAVIPLDKVFQDKICMKNEWYQLNSKTGKKEKERGDIQVTVQFTRNNLTASMYDLSIKGKHRSTFGKLKDRMKGKKRSNEEDTSSAIVPGVSRERSRLPSDGGGEEEYEDDEGGEGRRSKMRNFFLRGKLRKSSDTRSSTSLGSESSESSSRGGSLSPTAGISVVVSDLSNSPSNSSNFTADNSPEHPSETSPKLASHKRAFSYEAGEITIAVPQPTLCINGTQLYTPQSLEPGSGKPDSSLGQLQKSLPLSMSLQNIRPEGEVLPKGPAGDGRRWSFDKAGKEEKAAIAAALEQTGSVMGKVEEQAAAHMVSAVESDRFFSHGSAGKGASPPKDVSEQAPQRAEEKHKGWFGSKDSHSKPSLTPHVPGLFPWGPPAPPVDPDSLGTLLHHTNPFSHSQTTPPPMSPSNPFLSLLQHNPFFEELSADQALKPALPPLPSLSCRDPWPSVTSPPWSSNPNPVLSQDCSASEDGVNMDMEEDTMVEVWRRSLPPIPAGEKNPVEPRSSSNPFVSGPGFEKDAEWDDSFEAFAADRLKSPEESPTDYIPQAILVKHKTNYPLEDSKDVGITSLTMNSNKDMNVNYALQPTSLDVALKACTEDSLTRNKSTVFIEGNSEGTSNVKLSHTETPGTSTQFIDTIPAHQCVEAKVERSTTTDAAANPLELVSGSETKPVNLNTTNAIELTTNAHEATCHICNHSHSYSTQCPSLKDRNMDNSASPGSAAVNNLFERNDAHSNIPGSPEGASSLHTSVKDMVVMKSENVSPLATPLQTESPFSSSGVILDVTVQGLPGVAENDGGEETKSSEVSQEPSSTVQEMTLPQPKMSTMKEMMPDDDPLNKSISVFPDSLIHLVSTHSVSSHSDLNKLCQEDKREGLCKHDMEESFVSSVEEVNDSILTVPDNVATNIPAISDDENYLIIPSCHIMTSSPGECKSLREAPYGSTSGNQDISQRPPKPARLFSEFLLTDSDIGISPGLGFEEPLLHTKASDQSTSIIHSIYMSADSQHYQTCSSHHSSKCSNVSEEIPPKPRAETLPNSTPCEDEPSAETGAFESAAGTMSMTVLDQGELSDGCRASNDGNVQSEVLDLFHLGGMFVDQEKTVPLESSLLMGDYPTEPSSQTLNNALTDSFISSQFRDKVTDGVGTDQDDLCSLPQSALQRSLSEGTMRSSFEDLSPSFGSDPGVSLESSSLQHDSGLPPLLSFNPGLTVDRSPSLALSSCPNPPHATVRSSSSAALATAPFSTAKPMIGASHAVLPQETQQAANQQYSPHPVKPLTPSEERRPDGRSVLVSGLEKLKSTIHPGRSSQPTEQEPGRKKSLAEGAGSYYHLTHSELVTLLLQREAELKSQRAVFERQGALLEKRETELRKMKPQVRDLEDYIDTLLVRIMEQTPTLLQVRTKLK